jgi:teichuronic acid exporter
MFVGNTGRQALTFAFGIALARLLAPEDFGMLITIQVFTGLAGFFAGGGMGQALVRAKETSKLDYDIVFTIQLLIGCVIYAGFFFVAPWFARWYEQSLYADLLRVSALSFVYRPFTNIPGSILYRNMRYKANAGAGLAALTISSVVSVGMAYWGFGVWSLILGGIVGAFASMIMLTWLSGWRPGLSLNFARGRDIARYGLLTSATDVLLYLRLQASAFILSRSLGPASVALYNKGTSLAEMPTNFIAGSVYQVLFRALSAEQDNEDRSRYLFFQSIALVAIYTTPFYIGLAWVAQPAINVVYGPKWSDSATVLAILTMGWPFWLLDTMSGAVLAAKNWLAREVPVQVVMTALVCVTTLVGLRHGIAGVAIGMVCAAAYSGIQMYWLASRCLRARWRDLVHALYPALILNAILAGSLYLLDRALSFLFPGNELVYLGSMATLGACVYVLAFMCIPIQSLSSERDRWKIRLRLLFRRRV